MDEPQEKDVLLSRALVVGINDNLLCGEGWHDRTADGRFGLLYRPTQRRAGFDLILPGGDVEIIALISAATPLCGGILRGELLCGERLIGDFTLETENWTLRRFLFTDAPAGRRQFIWNMLNPFIPNDTLKNGDFREMGVYVASVRCEGKELLKE
jgi:hypothetical protein